MSKRTDGTRLRWRGLHRADELTGVGVPEVIHEAVRDLVRAAKPEPDLRRKRQQLLSFLLRHCRIYGGGGHSTSARRRWLTRQSFEHPAGDVTEGDVPTLEQQLLGSGKQVSL